MIAVEQQYRELVRAIGPGFHPDTPGEDYVNLPSGWTAAQVDACVEAAFAAGVDVYAIAMEWIRK